MCHEYPFLIFLCLVRPGQHKQLRSLLYFPCISVQHFFKKRKYYYFFFLSLSDCCHMIRILLNFYAFDLFSFLSFGSFLFLVVLFGRWEKG